MMSGRKGEIVNLNEQKRARMEKKISYIYRFNENVSDSVRWRNSFFSLLICNLVFSLSRCTTHIDFQISQLLQVDANIFFRLDKWLLAKEVAGREGWVWMRTDEHKVLIFTHRHGMTQNRKDLRTNLVLIELKLTRFLLYYIETFVRTFSDILF